MNKYKSRNHHYQSDDGDSGSDTSRTSTKKKKRKTTKRKTSKKKRSRSRSESSDSTDTESNNSNSDDSYNYLHSLNTVDSISRAHSHYYYKHKSSPLKRTIIKLQTKRMIRKLKVHNKYKNSNNHRHRIYPIRPKVRKINRRTRKVTAMEANILPIDDNMPAASADALLDKQYWTKLNNTVNFITKNSNFNVKYKATVEVSLPELSLHKTFTWSFYIDQGKNSH